jgi:hypothetical protein
MIKQIRKPVFMFATIMASSIMLSGCIVHVNAKDHGYESRHDLSSDDFSTTNKRVDVPDNTSAGEVSSVNGRLSMGDHVSAERVTNVNGKISIGDHVSVSAVKSVNGKVEIGEHFSATNDVSTVNGAIQINENSEVGGDVNTVNGSIKLTRVKVAQDVVTKNGSIYLNDESVVKGDIVFQEVNQKYYSWGNKNPTLSIDESSTVEGYIILKREVTLDIDNEALLSKVKREY